MELIQLDDLGGSRIAEFGSSAAHAAHLAAGAGEAHVYVIHIEPGGSIGAHPAGFGQLFLAVTGTGWVAAEDGIRQRLEAGQAAYIARGEVHAKGSDTGMLALMVQVRGLELHGASPPVAPRFHAGGQP